MSREIRHVTQLNNALSNDCAWACMAMLVNAYTGRTPSIDQLANRYGVPNKFTTVGQLVGGLNAETVAAKWSTGATWDWYIEKWDAGVPVIALLAMHEISDNDGYGWAHFAIVTGVEDDRVTIYNPLKLNGPRTVPAAEFKRAISARSKYVGGANAPFQAIYPLQPLVRVTRPASVILGELQDAAIAIQAEAAGRTS